MNNLTYTNNIGSLCAIHISYAPLLNKKWPIDLIKRNYQSKDMIESYGKMKGKDEKRDNITYL